MQTKFREALSRTITSYIITRPFYAAKRAIVWLSGRSKSARPSPLTASGWIAAGRDAGGLRSAAAAAVSSQLYTTTCTPGRAEKLRRFGSIYALLKRDVYGRNGCMSKPVNTFSDLLPTISFAQVVFVLRAGKRPLIMYVLSKNIPLSIYVITLGINILNCPCDVHVSSFEMPIAGEPELSLDPASSERVFCQPTPRAKRNKD